MKKKFLVVGAVGCAFFIWLANAVLGGFLYALSAFFTKEGLERWRERKKNRP